MQRQGSNNRLGAQQPAVYSHYQQQTMSSEPDMIRQSYGSGISVGQPSGGQSNNYKINMQRAQ